MTHQRAIEAGAQHLVMLEFGRHAKIENLTSALQKAYREDAGSFLSALAAEGLVVVPARPNYDMGEAGMGALASFHDEHPAACVDEIYKAMVTAAQQKQNAPHLQIPGGGEVRMADPHAFNPGDPFDAMAERFRREVTQLAIDAMGTTIYRDLSAQQQIECFLAGALTGIIGVAFSNIRAEGRDYMLEYIAGALPAARFYAESVAPTRPEGQE